MTWIRPPEDRVRSPFTGLTRSHWIAAAEHLLRGLLRHEPARTAWRLPRGETEITYPRPNDPHWRFASESMEGIARSLLIAAPLLREDPGWRIDGQPLADLYRDAILRLATPGAPECPGMPADVAAVSGFGPCQITCEAASLVLGLTAARKALWEPLDRIDRARVLAFLHAWGHAPVHPHNWRWFSVLVLSFLEREGQSIDRAMLVEHLRILRSLDVGDGWIRDGNQFDYYSPWAMQFYGLQWVAGGGRDTHPAIARGIVASAERLLETYDRAFARDGRMVMWGRSGIYRLTAVAPWAAAAQVPEVRFDAGVGRRVMSGCLRQFLDHPAFLHNGLPSIGFLGPFPPLVQPYSCAASPYWFGNSFQALVLPESHPFWTVTESEGSWADVPADGFSETHLPGPGLTFVQHGTSGETEWRTSKALLPPDSPLRRAYVRLAFHSALPWPEEPPDGWPSMSYRLSGADRNWSGNALLATGRRGPVLHRRLLFGCETRGRLLPGECPALDLADFPLPFGMLRCDRLRVALYEPSELVLGHYALPLAAGEEPVVEEIGLPQGARAWTVSSAAGSLAMVSIRGWQRFKLRTETGRHSLAPAAALPALVSERPDRDHGDPYRISLLLFRQDGEAWGPDVLWPFAAVEELPGAMGADEPAFRFTFRDNRDPVLVDYTRLDACLML